MRHQITAEELMGLYPEVVMASCSGDGPWKRLVARMDPMARTITYVVQVNNRDLYIGGNVSLAIDTYNEN
jgi:hypothetical protein